MTTSLAEPAERLIRRPRTHADGAGLRDAIDSAQNRLAGASADDWVVRAHLNAVLID